MTPSEFRNQFSLNDSQFKRLKSKVSAANPGVTLTRQEGNQWYLTLEGEALMTVAAQSRPVAAQSIEPVAPGASPSALTRRQPVEIVEAELVPEVTELQIVLPDFSSAIDRAQLEIANTAHVSSGNRNLRRQLRRQALIEAATAEAIEDFALADKAYAAATAALEQQQLNQLGLGVSAPAPAATAATPVPAKK